MRYINLILLFSTITFAAIAQPKIKVDGVAAIVGEKMIQLSEVENEFIQATQQETSFDATKVRCGVLDRLIMNKLLLIQAEIDSIKITTEEIDAQLDRRIKYFASMMGGQDKLESYYGKNVLEIKEDFREPIREQILVQRMEDKISGNIKVTPDEVKTYFDKIPSDSVPYFDAEFEIGQIVINPVVNEDAKTYAIEKLTEIRNRIVKGGEKFATLAVLYSEDPGSGAKGGELGYFGRGEMVNEFEAVSFRLKPGEVSNIIRTKYGYHILQIIDRKGDKVNARHILIKPPLGNSDFLKAKAEADSVREMLVEQKITFQEAVKKYSDDEETKYQGGLIINPNNGSAFFTADQLKEDIYFNIQELNAGEYTIPNITQNPDGTKSFKFYYLKSKTKPHKASLETDYNKIQAAALTVKKMKFSADWFETAKKKNYIKIDDNFKNCENLARWK